MATDGADTGGGSGSVAVARAGKDGRPRTTVPSSLFFSRFIYLQNKE